MVTSGDTGVAVPDVRVVFGDQQVRTDSNGQVFVPSAVEPGAAMDLEAAEFLVRQTSVGSDGTARIALWPRSSPSGLDEGFTNRVVYMNGFAGVGMLIRIVASNEVTVLPSPEIAADQDALGAHRGACRRLTDATRGRLVFTVVADSQEEPFVRSIVDANDPVATTGAGMRRSFSGPRITGATTVFKTIRAARSLGIALHELGHVFGLSHSTDNRDVMGPGPDDKQDYSEREKLVMRLMMDRGAGNRFPDNGRGAANMSSDVWSQDVECY